MPETFGRKNERISALRKKNTRHTKERQTVAWKLVIMLSVTFGLPLENYWELKEGKKVEDIKEKKMSSHQVMTNSSAQHFFPPSRRVILTVVGDGPAPR